MGQWKDKERGYWRFQFKYKQSRYTGSGFKTKKDAIAGEAAKRKAVRMGIGEKNKPGIGYILDESIQAKFDALKRKYHEFLKEPSNTLPDLFDLVMADFELPYSFKDVATVVRNYDKRKVRIPAKLRLMVLERDGYACRACGRKAPDVKLHVDHSTASFRGGFTEERNLRTFCQDCNLGKSNLRVAANR